MDTVEAIEPNVMLEISARHRPRLESMDFPPSGRCCAHHQCVVPNIRTDIEDARARGKDRLQEADYLRLVAFVAEEIPSEGQFVL
jgi:hypothetical protein